MLCKHEAMLKRFINQYHSTIGTFSARSQMKRSGLTVPKSAKFLGRPIISIFPGSKVVIGEHVLAISKPELTALGVSRPVILRTLNANALIHIGSDSGLSGVTVCSVKSVVIGQGCLLGADVMICDTDFHPVHENNRRHKPIPEAQESDGIEIGNDVFIGARAVILKGSKIGDGSVIGAGSVVASKVPPNSIFVGNPARSVGSIEKKP
jgi:acetyltransferase-like isoleucine patch superfamily enzyme